jgi:TP901 family phage tail tape measure protein
MAADLRIRWHLELVGDVAAPLLRQDRAIRSSMTQTERAQHKLATAAVEGGRQQARASSTSASALARQARSAQTTANDVRSLNRAQAESLSAGSRLAAAASKIASAYRSQATAAREASGAERARASAAKTASRVGAGAGAVGGGLSRLGGAAIGAAAGGGIVAKDLTVFAGFEQQMSRVAAVSGATRGQMAALTKQAEVLGQKTSFSARDAAGGMYELSTAGFKASEVMRAIPGTLDLAAASGTDLASAAALQASALRGFGLQAKDAGKVADALSTTVNRSAVEMDDLGDSLKYIAPIARATGQSMDSMLAAVGLMGNVGIKGSQAGTTLRTALVRLTNPPKKAAEALADLRLKASDLQGPKGLLPLPQIMDKIVKGAQGMDKSQRNAALAAIFGREALSGMVALVDKGPAALERNIKALQASEGTAKRTAHTMRANVAGAWDNFTGSLETAAITLTQRFSPALQRALSGGAGGINRLAAGLGHAMTGFGAGITGHDLQPRGGARATGRLVRGAGGRTELDVTTRGRGQAQDPSTFARVGAAIGGVARTIGGAALSAGRQLLDAFKPALPFFQNVLLPLLEGVGKGVLISVVGAFKVLVPVIKIVATALGFIGKVAKPLRPIFEGIGVVIGVLFTGPILKGIGLLGKLGGAFRLVGGAAKLLGVPIRVVGRLVEFGVGALGKFGGAFLRLPGVAGRVAALAGGKFGAFVEGLAKTGARAVSAVVRAVGKLPGRVAGLVGDVAGAGVKLGKGLVGALVDAIKAAPGAVIGAIRELIPAPLRKVAGHVPVLGKLLNGRRGGVMRRYQDGGLVPAMVSPGELVQYGAASWTVPGTPTAADSVATVLPAGAAVFTFDGQARLAAGESPSSVLSTQAPHFRAGGRVHPGQYRATAYGPPWTGIQGTGVTATGVNLRPNRRAYGVAVDPARIPLGAAVYAWPNPFGYSGAFRAFDTGGAIHGNRLDFYDWRGRSSQNHWGSRMVRVSTAPLVHRPGGTYTSGGAAAAPSVRILGRNPHRGGLVDDAFSQGLQAGQEGLTLFAIAAEGSPILAAIASALQGSSSSSSKSKRYANRGHKFRLGHGNAGLIAIGRMGQRKYGLHVGENPAFGGVHAGHAPHSLHKSGRAFDASGPTSKMTGFANAVASAYGATLLEEFWRGRGWVNIKNGRRVGFNYAGALDAPDKHTRHVHVAKRRGGLIPHFRAGGLAGGGRVSDHRHRPSAAELRRRLREWYAAHDRPPPPLFAFGAEEPRRDIPRTSRRRNEHRRRIPLDRHPITDSLYLAPQARTGGLIPRFQLGGVAGAGPALSHAATAAAGFRGHSLQALDDVIGRVTETRIYALRTALLAAIHRGGPQRVVQRLQAMLSEVDYELGRRVGRILDVVATRSGAVTRRAGQQDRALRRAGVDPSSSLGLMAQMTRAGSDEVPTLAANVASLKGAVRRAKKHGDRAAIRDLTQQLGDAQDALDEAQTSQVERWRDFLKAQAQESVDRAQSTLDLTQGAITQQGTAQRLAGLQTGAGPLAGAIAGTLGFLGMPGAAAAGTPEAMRQQAGATMTGLLPALQGQRAALTQQLGAAQATGDQAGVRAATLALQTNANDLATAVADAAQLLRDASVKAAQDTVDQAAHGTTLANTGLERLGLEQKLAGTYDSGGAARSAYITSNVVPALQNELGALKAQEQTYREQGMGAELAQTIEAEGSKQNEILQASLDAQQEIADNTNPRQFGGTLGFSFGGETLTDALVTIGNGV